jgi:hypothetical protein
MTTDNLIKDLYENLVRIYLFPIISLLPENI